MNLGHDADRAFEWLERAYQQRDTGLPQMQSWPPSATGLLKIRSISGTVEIAVPVGRTPAARLKSISGSIHNDCDEGTDGEIDVKTVSGTIRIECR